MLVSLTIFTIHSSRFTVAALDLPQHTPLIVPSHAMLLPLMGLLLLPMVVVVVVVVVLCVLLSVVFRRDGVTRP